MARKTQTKKPLRHRLKTYNFFLILAVLFGMIAGILLVRAFYQEPTSDTNTTPEVSLGSIEYDFSGGKAVKRTTPETASLKNFLDKAAASDCQAMQPDMKPSVYRVIAATKDISQVLLGYGCGDGSAHMFAVRSGETWKFISPTDHFEGLYDLPECDYVSKYSISKEIAPVCYRLDNNTISYQVR